MAFPACSGVMRHRMPSDPRQPRRSATPEAADLQSACGADTYLRPDLAPRSLRADAGGASAERRMPCWRVGGRPDLNRARRTGRHRAPNPGLATAKGRGGFLGHCDNGGRHRVGGLPMQCMRTSPCRRLRRVGNPRSHDGREPPPPLRIPISSFAKAGYGLRNVFVACFTVVGARHQTPEPCTNLRDTCSWNRC